MTTHISELKSSHGIIAEKHQGGGHWHSHRAYFATVRSPQGRELSALAYVMLWGFDELVSHGHAAEGNSEAEAVEKLCAVNKITVDKGATLG